MNNKHLSWYKEIYYTLLLPPGHISFNTLTATTEMVNAPFEVTAPVALQEQFSPFEDVSPPPAELPKVISFFADLDCGFSSKYVVIFLEKEVCGD